MSAAGEDPTLQAVRTAHSSFHHGTNYATAHPPPAKLGRTPSRVNLSFRLFDEDGRK
jgi:hypothetical protein